MAISVIPNKKKFYQRWWFWFLITIAVVVFGVLFFSYKTGAILNKISSSDKSVLGSLFGVVSNSKDIKKADNGRTNILLLGMRGRNVPGGGLLADSIMIASIKDDENKVALISVPRDLYVKVPGEKYHAKINAVYAHGARNGDAQGLKEMEETIGVVTGLPIDYGVVINFAGFKQLIDAVGGVDITLETPFYETHQFVQGKECGGQFTLPKGKNILNGEVALCYARARENTSDYDRAKRQQVILQALKNKLVSLGTLTDFSKLNKILNALGDNVKTDMSAGEMKKMFKKYSQIKKPEIFQRVFENSPEGMLTVPQNAPASAGFILVPRSGWDDYSDIHRVCKDIFELAPQSDIKPVKQYQRPLPKTKKKTKGKKSKK
jgi:LCP family protein required for cell wall assembly